MTTGCGNWSRRHFGEVAAGDDAELGRQRLEQHGDQVRQQRDPQQRVAVTRARLDVGGEIAGVHVGDRGDHRRPGEQQRRPRPPRRPPTTSRIANSVRSLRLGVEVALFIGPSPSGQIKCSLCYTSFQAPATALFHAGAGRRGALPNVAAWAILASPFVALGATSGRGGINMALVHNGPAGGRAGRFAALSAGVALFAALCAVAAPAAADDVTIDNLAFKSLDGDSFAIAHVEFTNTNLSKDEVVELLTPDTPTDDDRALAQKLKADKIAIPAIDILGKDGSKIHLDRPDRQSRRRRPDRGARSRLARGDGNRQRRRGLGQVRRAASRRPRRRATAGRRRSRQRRAVAEPPRRHDPQRARHRRAGPRGQARPDDPHRRRLDRGAQRIFRRLDQAG